MQAIFDKLTPVRRRQKQARTMRYFGIGLIAGALAAVILALASILYMTADLRLAGWVALACGPIAAIVMSQLSPPTWTAAAHVVDNHFQLDDRVQSAVTFLEQGKLGGLYSLQIDDTAARLAQLDTTAAVRKRLPKSLAIGTAWAIVSAALLLFLPQYEQKDVTADDGSPTSTPNLSDDHSLAVKPLPAGISWGPALNGQFVLSPEGAGNPEIDAYQLPITTTDELLDRRTDQRYLTNVSHDEHSAE